ncbi:hypothetical protein FRC04_005393 [Tulasnella sp. 424]|nr:hypothetical protein FRC04_005393 [Tulasnella sp. 424]KAG8964781.1 hypothetical protein FRC05_003571 [Tulasnella sp. 425]
MVFKARTSSPAAGSISTRRNLTIISISDLPYDILYIIFSLCWNKEHSPEQPSFPTIASHICRKWRDHALNTPSFWAYLRFDGVRLNLEKYQTWLERSGDYPLDIVFDGTLVGRRKTAKEALRLIVPSSDRWRSLRIYNVPEQVIRIIFDRLLDIPMPTLTKLKVMRKYDRYEADEPARTKWRFRPFLRGGAPRLESMVIERLSYEYIDARFTNLTTLDILDSDIGTTGSPVAPKVHSVLSRLPNLEAFRIRAGRSFPRHNYRDSTQTPAPYITPPLVHNSLKELSIQANSRVKNAVIISLALPEIRYFGHRTRPVREEWEITIGGLGEPPAPSLPLKGVPETGMVVPRPMHRVHAR